MEINPSLNRRLYLSVIQRVFFRNFLEIVITIESLLVSFKFFINNRKREQQKKYEISIF